MSIDELIHDIRALQSKALSEYRTRIVGGFGSRAWECHTELSDIDILVEPQEGASLFDLGGLQMELEAQLGLRVDVVSTRALRKEIAPSVMRDLITV